MIKGLKKVLRNLNNVKEALNEDIDVRFIELSLEWIANQANINLDQRTNGNHSSDARIWNIKIYKTFGILENRDMNSAAIEFGIGTYGENTVAFASDTNPSEFIKTVNDNSYQYNVPSDAKDDEGRWSFYDPRTQEWYIKFRGYSGKSFLFDALMEYYQKQKWKILYQQAFNEIVKGAIKK